jgi:hypothetical protein
MSTPKFPGDPSKVTLEEAKVWLRENVPVPKDNEPLGEAECPCCRQLVKIYRRKMDVAKAMAIILFYQTWPAPGGEYTHVPTFLKNGGPRHQEVLRSREWQRLADWDLLEHQPGLRDDGSKLTGYYRLTAQGVQFAKNELSVPESLTKYEGRTLKKAARLVSIDQVLGVKFNYRDLMAGT